MSAAMDKKKAKVAAFLKDMLCELPQDSAHPVGYLGWFYCMNTQHYYEAHDVLECLWHDSGKSHPNWKFYKGLIQVAGSFVHMKLHHEFPTHRVHGKRLEPASRLFVLAEENLAPYGPRHEGISVEDLLSLCERFHAPLRDSEFETNPWSPEVAPQLPWPLEPSPLTAPSDS